MSVVSSAQNLHVYYICYDQYDFPMFSQSLFRRSVLFQHGVMRETQGRDRKLSEKLVGTVRHATAVMEVD